MAGERLRVNAIRIIMCAVSKSARDRRAIANCLRVGGVEPKVYSHFKGQLAPAAVFYCARYTLGAG